MKKQKENSHEGITWSEMGKQNVQAKEVYSSIRSDKLRANGRNVSFSIFVRWSIYIINSVDKPNFRVSPTQHHSFLRN